MKLVKNMNKWQYLKPALNNDLYRDSAWIFSILALIKPVDKENIDTDKKFFLYRTEEGYFFVNDNKELVAITDADKNKPLFSLYDKIKVDNSYCPLVKSGTVDSTVGNLLLNWILVYYPFQGKIPYTNGVTISDIEETVAKRLQDEPENDKDRKNDEFYPSELEKFVEAAFYLTTFSTISVTAATKKLLLPPPGIKQYKEKLIKEKYKGKLDSYVKIADMENELKKYDKEYLKGDPSTIAFVNKKIADNARKRMFLSFGAEKGFDSGDNPTYVGETLDEGWPKDPKKLVSMFNSIRAGSYKRGHETQLGGVMAKVILRILNNYVIDVDDCGTKTGSELVLMPILKDAYIGRYIIEGNALVELTDNNIDKYIGKKVVMRSPLYCLLPQDHICAKCIGEKISVNKDGIALAGTEISDAVLTSSLKAMHKAGLDTEKLDLDEILK